MNVIAENDVFGCGGVLIIVLFINLIGDAALETYVAKPTEGP